MKKLISTLATVIALAHSTHAGAVPIGDNAAAAAMLDVAAEFCDLPVDFFLLKVLIIDTAKKNGWDEEEFFNARFDARYDQKVLWADDPDSFCAHARKMAANMGVL